MIEPENINKQLNDLTNEYTETRLIENAEKGINPPKEENTVQNDIKPKEKIGYKQKIYGKIPRSVKKRVLVACAKEEKTKEQIGKQYKISTQSVYNLIHTNRELYNKIILEMREKLRTRSLLIADKAVKNIKNDKLKASSGLQLSQIASNLNSISENKNNQINIQVNIPKDRESLQAFILGDDVPKSDPASVVISANRQN